MQIVGEGIEAPRHQGKAEEKKEDNSHGWTGFTECELEVMRKVAEKMLSDYADILIRVLFVRMGVAGGLGEVRHLV